MWETALLKAIQQFDSMQQFSEKLGVPRENVSAWLHKNIQIPLEYALCIESLTQGKVSWKELVPSYKVRLLRAITFSVGTIIDYPYLQIHVPLQKIQPVTTYKSVNNPKHTAKPTQCLCIDEQNCIVFGEALFYYYQGLGKKTAPVLQISLPKLLAGYYRPEAFVQNFSLCERGQIGVALKNHLGNRRGGCNPEKFPEWKGKETRSIIALCLGFANPKTYDQIERIVTKGCDLLQQQVDMKKIATSTAAWLTSCCQAEQKQVLARSKKEIIAFVKILKKRSSKKISGINYEK